MEIYNIRVNQIITSKRSDKKFRVIHVDSKDTVLLCLSTNKKRLLTTNTVCRFYQ